MEAFETYPVGSIVGIKDPGRRPDNWNSDMMRLIGMSAEISYVKHHGTTSVEHLKYLYTLSGFQWVWRHCDLKLLRLAKDDPNTLFRMKKHAA